MGSQMIRFGTFLSSVMQIYFLTLWCIAPAVISAAQINSVYTYDARLRLNAYSPDNARFTYLPSSEIVVPVCYSLSLAMVGIPLAAFIRWYSYNCVRVPCFVLLLIGVFGISITYSSAFDATSTVGVSIYNFWVLSATAQLLWFTRMILGRWMSLLVWISFLLTMRSGIHWLVKVLIIPILYIIHTRWSRYFGCFRVRLGLCEWCGHTIGACMEGVNVHQLLSYGIDNYGLQETFSESSSVLEMTTIDMNQLPSCNSVGFTQIEEVVIVECELAGPITS